MRKTYAFLGRVEAVVAGVFLALMVVLIFAGGVARLLHHPLNWTMDVSTCLFAWACFLCADLAWRRDGLMAVDILTERLPETAQRLLTLVNYLLIAGFLAFLSGTGFWLSWISRTRTFQGIPGVSYSFVTASLAVGGLLLLITTLFKIAAFLRRADPAPAQ
ncbi:TRAP transporter small permease [Aquabacter spiritensis]|uniref:TRAP transporter small permease protein n=1 Tax=Aquabacter spiritensis TaxID=933073 RepID=A0A4R3M3G2_9HYPH|nr:TRAP transporter small permease subunit [Aquabacter spiritensis]TCT07730.1 TRAP-type C4-dicarboxylate transport system permease small subunit [Aquabacter spiritensis]